MTTLLEFNIRLQRPCDESYTNIYLSGMIDVPEIPIGERLELFDDYGSRFDGDHAFIAESAKMSIFAGLLVKHVVCRWISDDGTTENNLTEWGDFRLVYDVLSELFKSSACGLVVNTEWGIYGNIIEKSQKFDPARFFKGQNEGFSTKPYRARKPKG